MNELMNILFVGDLTENSRSWQRYRALKNLGNLVEGISWDTGKPSSLFEKIFHKLRIPLDSAKANKHLLEAAEQRSFDVIWIEKGNTIRPKTLKILKIKAAGARLVSCSEDDMYAKHNRSCYYTRGLKYYDIVFTTKVYNLSELKLFGAKRTELFLDAYDEDLHRPLTLSREDAEKYGADVGFIGTFENDRAEKVLFLAENGIRVTVRGNGWGGWKKKNKNLVIMDGPVYGEEYTKAINATKINLCFLRKMNRDEVTSRSVEIPACGAFMLGERTKRHLDFFEEGKEAEFFGSDAELLEKTEYYLDHNEERRRIAARGRDRCLKSGYDHKSQLAAMLSKLS